MNVSFVKNIEMKTTTINQTVQFLDLKKINRQYRNELLEASQRVIDSGHYIKGPEYQNFCSKLSSYTGTEHVVGVGNGLEALDLVLRAWKEMEKLNDGDEVIVPSNTFIATILAILENNLKPVFVEPAEHTFNLDDEGIKNSISEKTKAIVVVHLYGRVCWSDYLEELKNENKLLILEDNAQAIGAMWRGKKTGSLGHAAAFSFYPGKNLGALGDGGAVSTNDHQLAKMVEALGNYGSSEKYKHDYKGKNSRLDEIQAAFLSVKLNYLDLENQKRRDVANAFVSGINNPKLILSEIPYDEEEHVWHLFVLRVKNREAFRSHMEQNGINTLIHYPVAPQKQEGLVEFSDLSMPLTEQLHSEVVSIPISQIMNFDEIEQIIAACNSYIG